MKTIMEGGHWKEKGYWYRMYFSHPTIKCSKTVNIYNREHIVKKFEANTSFYLINNSSYCNIGISIFGFGLGLEIHSREI